MWPAKPKELPTPVLEATSSQKVRATKVSSVNQGGEPTLSH